MINFLKQNHGYVLIKHGNDNNKWPLWIFFKYTRTHAITVIISNCNPWMLFFDMQSAINIDSLNTAFNIESQRCHCVYDIFPIIFFFQKFWKVCFIYECDRDVFQETVIKFLIKLLEKMLLYAHISNRWCLLLLLS